MLACVSVLFGALAALSGAAAAGDLEGVEIVVAFAPGTGAAERSGILADSGVTGTATIGPLDAVVAVQDAGQVDAALATLRADPDVAYAEPEGYARAALVPDDPGYLASPWPYERTSLPAAWDVTTGNPSVVVALLDSGIDRAQPDLANVMAGWDFVNGDADPADDLGHGTMVAGTLAAQLGNGLGATGVCPRCAILPVKVLGSDNRAAWSDVARGILWATDNGADVINISLDGPSPSQLVADAVSYANARGVIVVAAGGNAGSSTPSYPSSHPGVIGVAATDANDALYSWSNRGRHLELAAPGCVSTTYRTVESPAYGGACGTSFAAPMVAGVAALLLAANPRMTRTEVERALLSAADPLPGVDVERGRLDAAAALRPGMDVVPSPPANTGPPTLAGRAEVGQTLTATPGTWSGASPLTLSYAWARCDAAGSSCAPVAEASGQSYLLAAADTGSTVRVTVTAAGASGSSSASATSAVVARPAGTGSGDGDTGGGSAPPPAPVPVPPQDGGVGSATPLPSPSPPAPEARPARAKPRPLRSTRPVLRMAPTPAARAARVGGRLNARLLAPWADAHERRARFQWQLCSIRGRACANLAGKTAPRLGLTRLHLGKRVRVVIVARGPGGASWRHVSRLSPRVRS